MLLMDVENLEGGLSCSLEIRDTARADVRLAGELDNDTVPQAGAVFDHLMTLRCRHVVVDVSGMTFLGAAGLGLFATTAARLGEHGGCLRIVGASPLVLRLFAITGLDQVLAVDAAPTSGEEIQRRTG